jgi:hypothetical protein
MLWTRVASMALQISLNSDTIEPRSPRACSGESHPQKANHARSAESGYFNNDPPF